MILLYFYFMIFERVPITFHFSEIFKKELSISNRAPTTQEVRSVVRGNASINRKIINQVQSLPLPLYISENFFLGTIEEDR